MNFLFIIAMIAVQLAVAFIWLRIIIKMDRHRKKKMTNRAFPFLYIFGTFSAGVAVLIYLVLPFFYGTSGSYLMDDFLNNLVIVGPVEEFSKFIVFYFIVRKLDSVREPTDGLLQGATVGLAFASAENVSYAWWYGPGIIPYRSLFNAAGHMSYGALWGVLYVILTMSRKYPDRKVPFRHYLLALVPAGLAHGLYNYLLNYGIEAALVFTGLVIVGVLIVYRHSIKLSPYRDFDPRQHASTIPSIQLALIANPADGKLNYRLMLYAVYAGRLDLAMGSLQTCLKRYPKSSILLAWHGIIDIMSGHHAVGREVLESALSRASDRQKTILLISLQKVIRNPSRQHDLSALVSDGGTAASIRGYRTAREAPF